MHSGGPFICPVTGLRPVGQGDDAQARVAGVMSRMVSRERRKGRIEAELLFIINIMVPNSPAAF